MPFLFLKQNEKKENDLGKKKSIANKKNKNSNFRKAQKWSQIKDLSQRQEKEMRTTLYNAQFLLINRGNNQRQHPEEERLQGQDRHLI